MALEVGAPISGDQWQSVLKNIPSKHGGEVLLEHGTKARFNQFEPDEAQEAYPWVMPHEYEQLGITPTLESLVRAGRWRTLVKGADDYVSAVGRWGQDAVDEPGIRVGTIHSVKGAEADNVALLTTLSKPCYEAAQTQDGFDAEQRVWYVGATRARHKLLVIDEPKPRFKKRLL